MQNQLSKVCSIVLCLLMLSFVGGCSCWKDPLGTGANKKSKKPETLEEMEARRKELQEKQEEKPDFETSRLAVLPSDDSPTRNQIKPGHWFGAVQTTKANNYDFPKGDLEAQCVDTKGKTHALPETGFELSTTRPVNLPKGQLKHFDLMFYANPIARGRGAINLMTRLKPRGGGREVDWKYEATTKMRSFQNNFVVLAGRPDNYQFMKTLRSIKPQRSSDEFLSVELDYFVKLPKGTRRVDLPSHPLTWSNMAYVLWDDFEPEILSTTQQQSLIDWLHWGGQLIINGPRTLDRLGNSVLAPYLPAKSGNVGAVSDEQIAKLNEHWSFASPLIDPAYHEESEQKITSHLLSPVADEADRPVALELELIEDGAFVPNTADLVAQRSIGRGRIVVTAFNLPHKYFQSWDSYDTFFNACLLSRPARKFFDQSDSIVESWVGAGLSRDDPRITSSLRYFTRDAMAMTSRQRSVTRSLRRVEDALVPIPASLEGRDSRVREAITQFENAEGAADVIPGLAIAIDGPQGLARGNSDAFYVTVRNTGGRTLTGMLLELHGDESLRLTEGTRGLVVEPKRSVVTWGINPLRPGASDTIEVIGLVDGDNVPKAGEAFLYATVKLAKQSKQKDHGVEILAGGVMHQLDRIANNSYGVNGFAKDDVTGVAGWSDMSDASQEAKESLDQSAGISVPSVEFIAKVLGIYLVLLVPVNWILFKLIGRVEWAWAAIPVIAIGGALGVVQAAQLDIGFVRSRTEIAIVESHTGYDRGHVTRYIGFYTSLSSKYKVSGEEESTLIQPFAAGQQGTDRQVSLYQGTDVGLTGFSVASNTTGMVHAEQMLSLGGAIDYSAERLELTNNTDHDLSGGAIVRRNSAGVVEAAWVGDLAKRQRKAGLEFTELKTVEPEFGEWESTSSTSRKSGEEELNVRFLLNLAVDPKRLGNGDSVFVAWNDSVLPGITVSPKASQVTSRVVFVTNLTHGARPHPKRDLNSYAAMARDLKARKPDAISY